MEKSAGEGQNVHEDKRMEEELRLTSCLAAIGDRRPKRTPQKADVLKIRASQQKKPLLDDGIKAMRQERWQSQGFRYRLKQPKALHSNPHGPIEGE